MEQVTSNGAYCPVLLVEGLTAGYAGARRAIENVTFSLVSGERAGVIGPNGAGKSTLFKALVGIIPHQGGQISLSGADCSSSHQMIGYVPQQGAIDWSFPVTVWDVVMMGRVRKIGWLRWPRRVDREVVARVLEQVGMSAYSKRQIGQLSGGQRQRVFIARALAQETNVLLLDEPFNGVDVSAEHEIMETLETLKHDGITTMLATHDLHMASNRFDRVILLNRHIVAMGTAADIFKPDVLREAYGGQVGVFSKNGDEVMVIADAH